MDITEAFRTEDLSKADFFDFVVTPDNSDQQFQKQMRTVNAFLGNGVADEKEANNNMPPTDLTSIPTSQTDGNFDLNFWGDKETVRLETAILEDLNKYCWSTEDDVVSNGLAQNNLKHLNNNNNNNNNTTTDGGHIYTLTVLNGIDQGATWYRPPLTTIIKDEDASVSSPTSMEHLQPGIDIDSILNIMPAQMNAFNNNYQDQTGINQTTDGMIKSETYTYEDSGFADNKDELANSLIIDTPLLETHDGYNNNNNATNNNNNDWKLTNNNGVVSNGSADSLLRSALQGKAFVRYNGVGKKENNAELRRVLSTPPTKNETIFLKQDDNDKIPTIVAGIDANGTVIFEEQIPPTSVAQGTQGTRQNEAENPTSTHQHHMDDLLLSHLDQSYPEDFEKLKCIANEVAESVNQFCHIETSVDGVYSIQPDQIGLLNSLNSPISIAAPLVTSTKPTPASSTTAPATPKKYKRSNSNSANSGASGANAKQTTVQNATSTSNGVRKERSLHYCSICTKGFKDKYSVNVHIRTHTGEKPFACSLCGKSFRQKAHLAKHYQTHIAQKNAAAAGNVNASKTKTR
ncbi:homeobox protein 9 [Atheta coriaria]|uniref:homeobox protein 9 n=1 Tax=Dalotia coriaria TaxID=877792 RepID=UPI0031F368DF